MNDFLRVDQEGEVEVVGFYYVAPDGSALISKEPNLKSCCKGAASKIDQQLFLRAPLQKKEGEVVALKGRLERGEGRIFLNGAIEVKKESSMIESGGFVCLLLLLIFFVLRGGALLSVSFRRVWQALF